MSRHSSPTLCFSAVLSGARSAASLTMSAIVCEPVLAPAALTVPASIYLSPRSISGRRLAPRTSLCALREPWRPPVAVKALSLGGYCPALRVLEGLREESLVDPTLEDRHAELHALHDHFTPVHTCFACQLRRGQMDRHIPLLPCRMSAISFTPRPGRRNSFPAICIKWGSESR